MSLAMSLVMLSAIFAVGEGLGLNVMSDGAVFTCQDDAYKFVRKENTDAMGVKIQQLRDARGTRDCFVETGTNKGDTPNALEDDFAKLYTIEKMHVLAEECKVRFAGRPKIHCYEGDTTTILPEVIKEASRACVFWLDAHNTYGSDGWAQNVENPLLTEVKTIMTLGTNNYNPRDNYLVLDDFRLFGVGDKNTIVAYPAPDVIQRVACAIDNTTQFRNINDALHIFWK